MTRIWAPNLHKTFTALWNYITALKNTFTPWWNKLANLQKTFTIGWDLLATLQYTFTALWKLLPHLQITFTSVWRFFAWTRALSRFWLQAFQRLYNTENVSFIYKYEAKIIIFSKITKIVICCTNKKSKKN